MPQTRRMAAQTVCHFSHNADFWQLRISKYPANAHKTNYFSALVVGCFWCVIAISNIRNPLIYCVNCCFLMLGQVPSSKVLSCKHERLLNPLNLISKNVNIIFIQAATVARYPAATRLVADCKWMKEVYSFSSFADFSINVKTNGYQRPIVEIQLLTGFWYGKNSTFCSL